ncbi:hypothetical protein B0H14DRAFT_2649827 [Mycena olivaceomarginata]|nr:hypothetical protein B0H14DRAFT_2649827 [Mycena olivaceomarginata]
MAFGGRPCLFFALGASSAFPRNPSRSSKLTPILLNNVSSFRSLVTDVEGPSTSGSSLRSSVACIEDLDKERLRLPPELKLGLRILILDSSFFPSCKETENGKYAFIAAGCMANNGMSPWVDYGDTAAIMNSDMCAGESESIGKVNESVGSSFPKPTRILEVRTRAWAISLMRTRLCELNLRQEIEGA